MDDPTFDHNGDSAVIGIQFEVFLVTVLLYFAGSRNSN
jgi:hypothetical protein